MTEEPTELDKLWPYGFRREDRVVFPLGLATDLPGNDPHFAMLLAICNNTAIIAQLLERILDETWPS